MSAEYATAARPGEIAFAELLRVTRRNRFLPVPPQERNFVGDGDFRAIGCEFLRHFVELGGLAPDHQVLEIGCGLGRMALPLTQYLEPPLGRYTGFDVVAEGIAWAEANIAVAYENFSFRHLDYRNDLYNPLGTLREGSDPLPFIDASVDFAFMTSVVTHLPAANTEFYLAEAARLLRPGGRLFVTAFLLDAINRDLAAAGKARPPFDPAGPGPAYVSDPAHPMAAVACDLDWFLDRAAASGLHLARAIAFGHWSGRRAENFQDICVFTRSGGLGNAGRRPAGPAKE
jgi:SAM-dependent methyltransferase